MQQWEYWDTYARYGEPGPNFGELGLLGYELVSAFWHPHMECTCFYFKKPIPQQSIATEIFNEVKNEVEQEGKFGVDWYARKDNSE